MGASKWPDGMTSTDWYEVAGLMSEFEEQTTCVIELRLTSCGRQERPDMLLEATAYDWSEGKVALKPLASVRSRCSTAGMANLKGLCFFLLYQLDFQLGLRDAEESPKEA